jgi:hypothetical protein
VQVRDGKVTSVTLDGQPLEAWQYGYYGMPAMFNDIEMFLEQDSKPGQPRTFKKALFDANDGHIMKFIRRVMGSTERVEISVKLQRVEKSRDGLADRPNSGDNR